MAIEPLREPPPEEELPRPNLLKLREALRGPFGIRNISLSGLFILAGFYTLYFARSFLLPIVLAILFSLVLSPVVRGLKRLHIPEPLGAGLVLAILLGALVGGVYQLAGPAYDWMAKAPQSLRKVEARLREFKRPVQTLGRATEQVEKIAQVGSNPAPGQAVAVNAPSLGARIFSQTTELLADAAMMFILLFFLLASGDLFLRKLIKVLPSLEDKRRAVDIARQIESEISTYLSTIAMINVGLGLAAAAAMYFIGLPNPLLWGALVTLVNFVPYLGPLTCYGVFAIVGFLTFPDLLHALLPVGAFLVLNVLEAYIVSPLVLGRRLTLNPVVLFLGLTFWGWLWGIVGAILAVPIMVVFKIFCDHIEPLAPVGEFLGD